MISYGRVALLFCVLIMSCDSNVIISTKSSKYMVKAHVSELTSKDPVHKDVLGLLEQEAILDKKPVKFPLAYYLIQEDDTKVYFSSEFDQKILGQLYLMVSGAKYYKLFVHPDLEANYAFLRNAYRYIGPEETEFMATPTSGEKTIAVWTRTHLGKTPFIVKTEIDERNATPGSTRIPADTSQSGLPESLQMVFHRSIKGSKERIEGQQITKIPNFK